MSAQSSTSRGILTLLGASVLCSLGTLAAAADAVATKPAMDKPATEKCYGVARAAKNDCAAGDHSCAGQATRDFDKASFVAVPTGLCAKLAGGSLAKGM